MFTAIGLYVVVMLNGEEHYSVPAVYDTVNECLEAEKAYTNVVESGCFEGEFYIED